MEIIIDEVFKKVGNGSARLDFPAVSIYQTAPGRNCYRCNFNVKARDAFANMGGRVNWFRTDHYVICLPTKAINGYRFGVHKNNQLTCAFPADLITKENVKLGTYKLIPYKTGFTFVPYDPIKEEEV